MTTKYLIVRLIGIIITNITTMTDDKQIRQLASQLGRVAGAIKVLQCQIELNQRKGEKNISEQLDKIYKYAQLSSSEAYGKTIN